MVSVSSCSIQERDEEHKKIIASREEVSMLSLLNKDGILPLSKFLQRPTLDYINNLLKDKKVYNSHVPLYSDGVMRDIDETNSAISSYDPRILYSDPVIMSVALNPCLVALIEQYLGCLPTIYSFNCFYSRPGGDFGHVASQGTQNFHRDYDDFKFLVLFVYLNDVGDDNGPHRYEIGSHVSDSGPVRVLTGSAGDAFLSDSYGMHAGSPVKSGYRRMLWIRYGLGPNEIYFNDKNDQLKIDRKDCSLPLNDRDEYLTRLLFHEDV